MVARAKPLSQMRFTRPGRLSTWAVFLCLTLISCKKNSSVDDLFADGPVDTVIVEVPEDLQITINTPSADGKNAGFEVYMAGGCTLPGGTVEFRGGATGFSVCQANNTWEANVDVSGAAVGNVTVEVVLSSDGEQSAAATRILNKTNSDCDSSAARSAVYATGDGVATPYAICTSAQFNNIRLNPTANFALKNDLDMQNVPFTPIPNTFRGTLDGGDFTIKRLYIYDLSSNDTGIFKGLRDGAVIQNFTLESANVTGPSVVGIVAGRILGTGATIQNLTISGRVAASTNWIGGVVAYVDNGVPLTISNVDVSLTSLTGQNYAGGVLGGSHTTAGAISISDAQVSGSLTITNGYLGGIAGFVQSPTLTLSDVHSTASVTNNGGVADNYIGGILGATSNASGAGINIDDCSSSGTVSASGSYVGGVAGRFTGTKIWNCEVTGAIVGDSSSRAISFVGGLAGWTNANDTDVYQSNVKVDISITGATAGTYYGGLFGSFIGTRIEDSHARGDTANSLPGTISITCGDGATTGSDQIGGAIGRVYVNNGNTTTIANSTADINITHDGYNTNAYVGGYVGNLTAPDGATASTVVVNTSSATGNVTAYNRYIGGWAGQIYVPRSGSNATLTNVSASGNVQVSSRNSITPHYIGGFVGWAQSRDAGDAETAPIGHQWTNVRATGDVTVDSGALGGNYVGGLAGYLTTGRTSVGGGSSTLNRIYATGTVSALSTGANFNYVGGLFGRVYTATNATTVINSTSGQTYATGDVTGHGNNIGGLIGSFDNGTSSTTTINDAYSNGDVIGRQNVGGAIGNLANGTTATMTINNLRSHDSNVTTPANTVTATANSAGGLIGYASSTSTTFLISNSNSVASVSSLGGYAGGLIGQDRDNVDLNGCSASGSVDSPQPYVGGLTGGSDRTGRDWVDVEASGAVNASVTGAVNNIFVGGLSGYMRGTIEDARAHGDIQIILGAGATINQAFVGGLVGYGNSLTITEGLARGSISYSALGSGNMSYTGGLVGWINGAVTRSFATGEVEGGNYTGGLIGQTSSTVSYSFAAGNVSGIRFVGGLVGNHTSAAAGSINFTYALGSVERNSGASTDYFGQLVGFCNGGVGDAKVTNSFYNSSTSLLIAPIVGQSVCNSATAGRSLTNADMLSPGAGFAGWDFIGTDPEDWRYPTAFTKKGVTTAFPYPILYWAYP